MGTLVMLLLLGGAGYAVSLRLHPLVNCRVCKGTGRHSGAFFAYSSRLCGRCGGSTRVPRLGVRLFLGGDR